MGKAATPKKARKSKVETDPTQDYLEVLEAKQRFVGSALNMGWQLAVAFIIPVAIGAWLDNRFDTSPSYTITGIFLAIIGSVMIISKAVKEANADTAALSKKSRKRKPKNA